MKKQFKKIGAIVLTLSLSIGSVSIPAYATSSEEIQNKIDNLNSAKSQTQSEVNSLANQLNDLIEKIDETEKALVAKGEEVIKSQEELEKAQNTEQKQYRQMKKRIVRMYENGNADLVNKLFQTDSLSDLLTKYEYVEQISDSDKDMFDSFVEAREEVKAATEKLQKEQAELEEKEAEYQAEQDEVNALLEEKQDEIAYITDQLSLANQQLIEAKEEERKAAEEAARKAAEAAAAAAAEEAARQAQEALDNNEADGAAESAQDADANETQTSQPAPAPVTSNDSKAQTVTGNVVVDRALSQLGKPYVWGACGPSAFDCSGLVSYALTGSFSRLGTSSTFGAWTRVSNPQPGDIVCYPGHVAIYYGNGMQIEAQQSGVPLLISHVRAGAWYTRY